MSGLKMVPTYRTVTIGIKNPQERTVLPLSWSDVRKLQNLIFQTLSTFGEIDFNDPVAVYNHIFAVVMENVVKIANLVVEGDEIDEKELSLLQASELANIVFDMNFEGVIKNFQSLLLKLEPAMKKAME